MSSKTPITDVHRAIVQESQWLNTSRPIVAEDLQGRVILLDFWTFCCINCMHVIPELQALEHEFGDKLTVIGVHSAKFANEKDSENIRQAMLRYEVEHAVVNDKDFRIWRSFGVNAWPTLILINPRGQIERVYSGEGNKDAIADDIRSIYKKHGELANTSQLPLALEAHKEPETVLRFPGKLSYAKGSVLGNVMFVSDSGHHQIVAFDLNGKEVLRVGTGEMGMADGTFNQASFNAPQGVLYHDNNVYIADTENHMIRKIDLQTKHVTTLAGTGKKGYERFVNDKDALETTLASPWDLAFYPDDTHLVIAMAGSHQLWVYNMDEQTVSVLAGNGSESIDDGRYPLNSLSQPSGLSVLDGKLYFVDSETSSLRVLDGKSITTLIGTGLFDFGYEEGGRSQARMQHALGIYADDDGIYIADSYNHSIRRYDAEDEELHNYAGHAERGNNEGALLKASFNEPNDIERVGEKLYVTDTNNHHIRVIDMQTGKVSSLAVTPEAKTDFSYADGLPNVRPISNASLQPGRDNHIKLHLPKGWKINDDAPSWMALFAMEGKPVSVWGAGTDMLKSKNVTLPELKSDTHYQLQGTLYYCKDEAGSLCLIQSVDQKIEVEEGAEGVVEVELVK